MGYDDNEERRVIKGYEELYDITRSGRIIAKKTNHVKYGSGSAYGYPNVHLYRNGERELFKTRKLWRQAFPELPESEYRGQ